MRLPKTSLPFFSQVSTPNYGSRGLWADIAAGITVGVLLIPQGMAYALIIGLPPVYGLYASLAPLLIYALLGTSRSLAIGPTALSSLLTVAAIGPLAAGDPQLLITLAISMAFWAGLIRFLLGTFQLGFLADFLSKPILSGFTAAAGIIIASSQLKHILGIQTPGSEGFLSLWTYTFSHLGDVHIPTLVLGGSALAFIGVMRISWIKKRIPVPGTLLLVVLAIACSYFTNCEARGISLVGTITPGLPYFTLPNLNLSWAGKLLPGAITLAVLGFIESISIAKWAAQQQQDHVVKPNQELASIGLANMAGAFLQGFPVTGSFSRTAINHQLGNRTQVSGLVSALFVLLTLLFLTPLLYFLPKAALAAIIIMAVIKLVDIPLAKRLWQVDKPDFMTWLITFLATLFIGIEMGVLTGVLLALLLVVYQTARPHYAVLGRLPGSNMYRNVARFPKAIQRPDLLAIRFDARLFFGNAGTFREIFTQEIQQKPDVKLVVLSASSMHALDATGVDALREVWRDCQEKGIVFYISGAIGPMRDACFRHGLFKEISRKAFFLSVHDAVAAFDAAEAGIFPAPQPEAHQYDV